MLEMNINSSHVFHVSNVSDRELKEIEEALSITDSRKVCYSITKNYGLNTVSIQIEARYEYTNEFVEVISKVTTIMMNHKSLWKVKTEVDW